MHLINQIYYYLNYITLVNFPVKATFSKHLNT